MRKTWSIAILILIVLNGCSQDRDFEVSNLSKSQGADNTKLEEVMAEVPVADNSVVLSAERARNLTATDVVITEEIGLQILEEGVSKTVENVESEVIGEEGYRFYFLSTGEMNVKLLVTINEERSELHTTEYYEGSSFFSPEHMIVASILPHPPRHLKEIFVAIDLRNNRQLMESEINHTRNLVASLNMQELYYLEPNEFRLYPDGDGIEIFWEQAHYPMKRVFYSISQNRILSNANDGNYRLDELAPKVFTIDINADGSFLVGDSVREIILPVSAVGSRTILTGVIDGGSNRVSLLVNDGESTEAKYEHLFLLVIDSESGEVLQETNLGQVFPYQDAFVSAQGGQWDDATVSYILETAEFSYDFYWNYQSGTYDAYLRPSSFTTRYPK